ncbi:hypothetical protein HDV62DRAFT_363718 [Trichoderma sp. SZMC 28011]
MDLFVPRFWLLDSVFLVSVFSILGRYLILVHWHRDREGAEASPADADQIQSSSSAGTDTRPTIYCTVPYGIASRELLFSAAPSNKPLNH